MFCILFLYNIFNLAIADESIRLAVLEFTTVGSYDSTYLLQLSDETRGAALEVFPSSTSKISVLTRENILDVLSREGKDASCLEASCAVGVGRNIGARFIIVGNLTKIENTHSLTLKVFDSQSNDLIAQQSVRENNQLQLLSSTRSISKTLLETSLSQYDESRLGIRKIGGKEETWEPPSFDVTILDINTDEAIDANVYWKSDKVCSSLPCSVYVPMGIDNLKILAPQCDTFAKKLSLMERHSEFVKMECHYGFVDRSLLDPNIVLKIDNKPLTQQITKVATGKKTISIQHPCYHPTELSVDLSSREILQLTPLINDLTPITKTHQFMFTWDTGGPIEGDIIVDQNKIGTTNAPVEIPICADDISLQVNENTTFNIPKEKLSSDSLTGIFAKKGFINLQFDESTVTTIDGEPVSRGRYEVVGGFHTITMKNNCFEDYQMDVSISSNEELNIVYEALRRTPKKSTVTFDISANQTVESITAFVDGEEMSLPTGDNRTFSITKDKCSEHSIKIDTKDGKLTYNKMVHFIQETQQEYIKFNNVDISSREFHQPHLAFDIMNHNISSRNEFQRFGETQATLFKYKPKIPSLHLTLIEVDPDYTSFLPIGLGYQYDFGWISMMPFTSVNWNQYNSLDSTPFEIDFERLDLGAQIYFNYNDYNSDWIDSWSDMYGRDPWDFGTVGKAGRIVSLRGGISYLPNTQTVDYFVGGSIALTGAGWGKSPGDGLVDAYLDNTRFVGLSIFTIVGFIAVAIGSAASDRRMKKNIIQIGESKSGIPIYQFEYNDPNRDGVYVGTMAQDLLQTHPYAVIRLPFTNYYRVVYHVIDVDFYRND